MRLIRNGAIPVQDGDQGLRHIESRLFKPLQPRQVKITLNLSKDEKLVVSNLNQEQIHVDNLVSDTGMELTQMLSILLELELKGVV